MAEFFVQNFWLAESEIPQLLMKNQTCTKTAGNLHSDRRMIKILFRLDIIREKLRRLTVFAKPSD